MSLNLSTLTRRLFRRFTKPARPQPNRVRLGVTHLEDRVTPTTVTVQSLGDVTEGGTGTFRLTRSDTAGGMIVAVQVGGTATSGTDYTSIGAMVFFGPTALTADVTVSTTNDTTSEATETVTLAVAGGMMDYSPSTPGSATMNIRDNDAQVVTVTKIDDAVENGAQGKFRVSRIGDLSGSLTVNLSVGGTATNGTDYSTIGSGVTLFANSNTADISVAAAPDNLVEGTETVTLTVTSGTGYTVGSPSSATVNITDDPPVISVEAADTFEGAATGGFSFIRTGGLLSEALTISYSVGGTATSGTDYTALSGSVTFAANQDRVEVAVEASGDNSNDDAETVIVTLTGAGSTYTIASGAGSGTVTIADQPLTISVIALSDGEEGGANPVFRFLRSGDVSSSLTVSYTVSGTATSGTDFTAMAGSVTFNSTDTYKDVTVSLSPDTTAEPTETITVTLDEPPDEDEDEEPDYSLGNDSDTAFIKDNDTNRVIWLGGYGTGSQQTDWNVPQNWTSNSVPTESDDVYFDGSVSNSWNCVNVGASLSGPLYGMHVINGFSQTLILASALSVGTYEQKSGLLNQPSARDLTVTSAMLWSGGTLDATASGANVNIDGAAARIDPPDSGSMSTSCTLRMVNEANVVILPGQIDFLAGNGLFLAADAKGKIFTNQNVEVKLTKTTTDARIQIAWDGTLEFVTPDGTRIGTCVSELPIANDGTFTLNRGIQLDVKGRIDGGTTPSLSQANGIMHWWTGSNIRTEFGMTVASGNLTFHAVKQNSTATLVGAFVLGIGTLGAEITFDGELRARFEVQGDVNWHRGTYKPRLSSPFIRDRWIATQVFTLGEGATFAPIIAPDNVDTWAVIEGWKGIQGSPPFASPTSLADVYVWYKTTGGVPPGGEAAGIKPK